MNSETILYYLKKMAPDYYAVMVDGDPVGRVYRRDLARHASQEWIADTGRDIYGPFKSRKRAVVELTDFKAREISELQYNALMILRDARLPRPEVEFAFHDSRKWRFDLAYVEQRIAVEIDGGTWTRGAHVRGAHFQSDAEKRNTAQLSGWRVFVYTPKMFDQLVSDLNNALKGMTK